MNHLPAPPEADVQRACIVTLEAHGVVPFRNNSRVFRVPGKGGRDRLMRLGLGKGSADLIGLLPPTPACPVARFLAVETKRRGEVPTVDQILWLERINAAGGLALWADDAALLEEMFRHLAFCEARRAVLVVRFGPRARVEFVMREGATVGR